MANLTANVIHRTEPRAGRGSYVVADATQLYAGSFVGINAAGYLDKWADTAGHKFVGILLEDVLGDTSASPPVEGRVDDSGVTLKDIPVATASQASVNSLVYCETDNPTADCDLSASTNVEAVGWLSRLTGSGVGDVTLFTPEEHWGLN